MNDGNDENDQLPSSFGENPKRKYLVPVLLSSDGVPWKGELHAFTVNAPNTPIATVISVDTFTCKRQVWGSGTGDLLWTNQNDARNGVFASALLKIPPRFSPDGNYVVFYLNRFEISSSD
jgi:hypothetical protein